MAVQLDDVDITLLTALQEDADRTNVELARLAGLSPAATLHRVRRLKEAGVIRIISAQLDPAAAGFPLQGYGTGTLARPSPRLPPSRVGRTRERGYNGRDRGGMDPASAASPGAFYETPPPFSHGGRS